MGCWAPTRRVLSDGAYEGVTPGAEVRDPCKRDPHFVILVFWSHLWEWMLFLACWVLIPLILKVPPT